jgi:hypothetical protein
VYLINSLIMKTKLLPFIFFVLSMGLFSCNDQCEETRISRRLTPLSRSLQEIRSSVKTESKHELVRPGKIYSKGGYLFINEIKEGIHVIDNSDPGNPRFVSFIVIPGNGDIAVRNNILYADSFSDLVALDISDPENAREVGRVENVFRFGQFDGVGWSLLNVGGIPAVSIQDYTVDYVTETVSTNCEENWGGNGGWWLNDRSTTASFSATGSASSSAQSNGQAGSMARFALYDKYLYTVEQNNLHLFNISNPAAPGEFKTVTTNFNIETIFPYENKLFLGTTTGMLIFDNTDPAQPKQLSTFQHGRACDPVVVHNDIAYVTLRTGTACAGTQNQLDVVDVSDASAPRLLKTYQMENPHGLSINFPTLFLCEGDKGLKVFDVKDNLAIDQHLLSFYKDMDAYDVISLGNNLMLIGKDGFYQYDAGDPGNLRLLSKIPVKKAQP